MESETPGVVDNAAGSLSEAAVVVAAAAAAACGDN